MLFGNYDKHSKFSLYDTKPTYSRNSLLVITMLTASLSKPRSENGKYFQRNSSLSQYEQNGHTIAKGFLPRRVIKFIIWVDPTSLTL